MRLPTPTVAAVLLALALACSGGDGADGKERLRGADGARVLAGAFDWSRPAAGLELTPDEVAARVGSFEWAAALEWSVSREGGDAARVHAVERHLLRQAPAGEFQVQSDLDPGLGPGSETGREIVFVGGNTYARARHAPFRERPTDRGRDARRYRDESFLAARSLTRLLGARLELTPERDVEVLRRPAKRFALSLAKGDPPAAARPTASAAAPEPDDDTARRRAFLAGLRPASATGEIVLDAATGAPLRVRIAATFSVEGDPSARATVELLAQVKAIGANVQAISAPGDALPDERKAAGVAGALEAAGLKKRGERSTARPEPADGGGDE